MTHTATPSHMEEGGQGGFGHVVCRDSPVSTIAKKRMKTRSWRTCFSFSLSPEALSPPDPADHLQPSATSKQGPSEDERLCSSTQYLSMH